MHKTVARACESSMFRFLSFWAPEQAAKKQTRRDSWYSFDHSFTLLFLSFFHSLKRATVCVKTRHIPSYFTANSFYSN